MRDDGGPSKVELRGAFGAKLSFIGLLLPLLHLRLEGCNLGVVQRVY